LLLDFLQGIIIHRHRIDLKYFSLIFYLNIFDSLKFVTRYSFADHLFFSFDKKID